MGVINIQNIKVLKNPYSKTLIDSDPTTSNNKKNKNNGIDILIKKLIIVPNATLDIIGIKNTTFKRIYIIVIPIIDNIISGIFDIDITTLYDKILIDSICKIIKYITEYILIFY